MFSDVRDHTTVRARCYFLGRVAAGVIDEIRDQRANQLAQAGMAAIEAWQREPDQVSGDDVYKWIGDNEDEDGLIIIVQMQDAESPEQCATLCVISALCYVAWRAYCHERLTAPPNAIIAEIDESVFDETIEFALKVPSFNVTECQSLARRLLDEHSSTMHGAFGIAVV